MNFSSNASSGLPKRQVHAARTDIVVQAGSVLLYGVFEQRSEINQDWLTVFGEDNTYEVISGENLHSVWVPRYRDGSLSLRNQSELLEFIKCLNASSVYIDITGLAHHVWMPIIRVTLLAGMDTNCIYVEPEAYTYNPNPRPGEFFDLSERFHGFSPLPTFARLSARRAEETILIPLLGFEGIRFRHLIEKIEPSERDVSPVVGVPGFELEYPFHTLEGNAAVLSSTRSWQRMSFVDAVCPFSLYLHLERVQEEYADRHLQIATIGTKPHALGAMLYALNNTSVELLYDHPVRRQSRTKGMARCHLYKLSEFLQVSVN